MKRGISVAISWVLLIGLAVMLAIIVMTWSKAFSEGTTKTIKDRVEKDIKCTDVSIKSVKSSASCHDLSLKITNSGYFTVKKVRIRGDSEKEFGFGSTGNDDLKPTQTKTLNTKTNYNTSSEVNVIPIVEVEGKQLPCFDREVKVVC